MKPCHRCGDGDEVPWPSLPPIVEHVSLREALTVRLRAFDVVVSVLPREQAQPDVDKQRAHSRSSYSGQRFGIVAIMLKPIWLNLYYALWLGQSREPTWWRFPW